MTERHEAHPGTRTIVILAVAAGVAMASSVAGAAVFGPHDAPEAAAARPEAQAVRQQAAAPPPAARDTAAADTGVPDAAGSGLTANMVRRALAVEAAPAVNAPTNAPATNGSDPLRQAASGAEAVVKSAGLKAAVTVAWQTAWEKSWPSIKSMTLRFFGLIAEAWRSVAKTATTPAPAVNAGVSSNAPVNAAQ